MTVEELIAELRNFPLDTVVEVRDDNGYWADVTEVWAEDDISGKIRIQLEGMK